MFTLGDTVIVSDPCYKLAPESVFGPVKIENVKPGVYVCEVEQSDEGSWGVRNARIIALHLDYCEDSENPDHEQDSSNMEWEEYPRGLGVDSGQLGIFSLASYRNDRWAEKHIKEPMAEYITKDKDGDVFYGKMCSLTNDKIKNWGVYPEGAVTSTGFGDGSYTMHTIKNYQNQVVGFAIQFI
jgi:hypothetical protein